VSHEKVSVVVPCFNGEQFLYEALDSVFSQTIQASTKVIVGDDGSTDDSIAIARSFGSSVHIVFHPDGGNHGLAATRNLILHEAQGDFIAFLDADDIWLPDHLKNLVEALEANPQLAFAVDNGMQFIDGGHDVGDKAHHHRPGIISPDDLLLDQWFAPSGLVMRRVVLDKIGLFDSSMRYTEDQDLWLRILENYPATYIGSMGYRYRLHGGQLSTSMKLWDGAEKALEKAIERHPYPHSIIRKRRAVIAYRRSQHNFATGYRLQGLAGIAKAAFLDPPRAVKEIINKVKRKKQ